MDKELEQQAIATFVQQPEVYAEFLNNNGQDGSQIPVEEIKKDPDTYVQAFQKDKKFHDTIVGLFQEIVKSQQKSSMFREGGKFDYLKKLQEGGSLTRKQALEAAQKNRGFTRQQARRALRNARYAGADRQTAFAIIAGEPTNTTTANATPERPQLINSVNNPVGNDVSNVETINARPTADYNNVDFGVFKFNDAFGRARKAGLNEFT